MPVIFLLLICVHATTANGQRLTISASPPTVDYGQSARVKFAFTPPCSTVEIFRTSHDECFIGTECPNGRFPTDRSHTYIILPNQTSEANDNYWAVCLKSSLTMYKTLPSKLKTNLNIGVNPIILDVEVHQPNSDPLTLHFDRAQHRFLSKDIMKVKRGKVKIEFSVGIGNDPTNANQALKFQVPEFDDPNSIFKRSDKVTHFPIDRYPPGVKYRYSFKTKDLRMCKVGGTASASLSSHLFNNAPFSIEFAFDPVILDITVKFLRTNDGENSRDCLFHCVVAVCPKDTALSLAWSFSADATMPYQKGNIYKKRQLYVLRRDLCDQMYQMDKNNRKKGQRPIQVGCRITLENGHHVNKRIPLHRVKTV